MLRPYFGQVIAPKTTEMSVFKSPKSYLCLGSKTYPNEEDSQNSFLHDLPTCALGCWRSRGENCRGFKKVLDVVNN